uniref:RING-type E3 ubiquitin transferase n=1 Tax=Davidia involucrata TaxID=16924 RepID=A0A5B7B0T7_DAVIN
MAHHLQFDDGFPPPTSSIAVAIDKDKHSQYVVRWAIDHLLITNPTLILIHVRIPNLQHQISGMIDAAPDAHGGLTDSDLQQLFSHFHALGSRKGIIIKEAILEDSDVSKALLEYVNNNYITSIVLGASTRNGLARKFRNHDVPTTLNKCAPDFCSVYVISKGKALSVRPAATNSATSPKLASPRELRPHLPSDQSEQEDGARAESRRGGRHERMRPNDSPTMDILARGPSIRTSLADGSDFESIVLETPRDATPPSSSKGVKAEMKRLKLELKQTMSMYNSACKEAVSEKKKAEELHQWKIEEAHRFEQAQLAEEAALAIAEMEKAKCRAAMEAAEKAQKLAEMEAHRRKYAELKAKREAEEKNRALNVLSNNDVRYRKYTIEEIETATENFSESLKIGEGGYGPVYKAKLDHTPVAIKVLRPDAAQGRKQFQQEVEILSCVRHPNMVLLLGACPEYGCLVYEFMNNGSLEDRLFRKGNTPSIPWRIRFKIAADIATGLMFLHQAKPEPLVHRDLKPANILLDRNNVCKISDVGLARLVPPSVADSVTQYHMTSAAGTFCYIDPEYQQTGMLGKKSDIYSLGILLLQIVTARPPMGLTHHVERAIEEGKFAVLLDPTVPDWPVEEALQFAKLALKCAELRKKDRPDLGAVVLPELNRLRELGSSSKSSNSSGHNHEHHFQSSSSQEDLSNLLE